MLSEQVAIQLIDALKANTAALLQQVGLPVVPVVPAAGATPTHGTRKYKRNAKDYKQIAYNGLIQQLPGIAPFITPPNN